MKKSKIIVNIGSLNRRKQNKAIDYMYYCYNTNVSDEEMIDNLKSMGATIEQSKI